MGKNILKISAIVAIAFASLDAFAWGGFSSPRGRNRSVHGAKVKDSLSSGMKFDYPSIRNNLSKAIELLLPNSYSGKKFDFSNTNGTSRKALKYIENCIQEIKEYEEKLRIYSQEIEKYKPAANENGDANMLLLTKFDSHGVMGDLLTADEPSDVNMSQLTKFDSRGVMGDLLTAKACVQNRINYPPKSKFNYSTYDYELTKAKESLESCGKKIEEYVKALHPLSNKIKSNPQMNQTFNKINKSVREKMKGGMKGKANSEESEKLNERLSELTAANEDGRRRVREFVAKINAAIESLYAKIQKLVPLSYELSKQTEKNTKFVALVESIKRFYKLVEIIKKSYELNFKIKLNNIGEKLNNEYMSNRGRKNMHYGMGRGRKRRVNSKVYEELKEKISELTAANEYGRKMVTEFMMKISTEIANFHIKIEELNALFVDLGVQARVAGEEDKHGDIIEKIKEQITEIEESYKTDFKIEI
ncbi:MAG: hypothetical protein LBJ45_00015 [Holosporaceae bacterium]|jgi:tetratricopeptide (TPR) repeat protein|nr:hypothetical protein [Holosporaceae bacterium]